MFNELLEILRDFFRKLFASRLFALSVIFTLMFAGLIGELFHMQIMEGKNYQEEYMQRTEKSTTTPGTRGNIYDRNGNILAYNKLAYIVTIQDAGDYPRPAQRNAMLLRLVDILEQRGETVEGKLELAMDQNGEIVFSYGSESNRNRFLLNLYGLPSTDKLDDARGRYPSDITAREAFEYKKKDYELNKMKDDKGNPLILSDRTALNIINIIYTMKLTEYQKYETTTVSTGISDETMMEINENMAVLKGVSVEQSSVRVYQDSLYFAPIIGYTGKVQEKQIAELNQEWRQSEEAVNLPEDAADKYDLNDIVGRTGIEYSMELELQGGKGYSMMYVDNMGRPREIIQQTDAMAGDDVYLTIDRELQIAIYNLIEKQLAGILAHELVNEDVDLSKITDSSKIPIPVKDAYYQLINNNVLSISAMSREDAADIEKEIYSIYQSSKEQIINTLSSELKSPHARAMNQLPEDLSAYMDYICDFLSDDSVGIIQKDKINESSPEHLAWKEGTISLRDYIYSGISSSWVDTTRLDVTTSKYSDADDIFNQLADYVTMSLEDDSKFTKKMFRYLVNNQVITGRQLCLALYSQGVLENNPQEIAALQSGDENYAFVFIRDKISKIELTPAQLALDPCTAGCVVTDVRTGEVRALVTYPSYDNNLLSGSVDADYYSRLNDDISKPLYNNATQARKAPGSTFKPITAVAALEEGVINMEETVECTGDYTEVTPDIKCWIYPGRHNHLNMVGAIENSCNYFFSEVAHRMGTNDYGVYSTDAGLEVILKYARMFGLDHASGVEISENDPQLTDKDLERSAIGQGNHSYTNVQLSRYVTAVANRGTVFELSLLDKLTDSDGNLKKDYTPEVHSQIEVADSTWDAVQSGMRRVITDSSAKRVFSDLPVEVAGKTGTAQETKTRANHAFFVSFAPYSQPEIAVTINIPYGYAGTNAATLGKKVYEYYYGYTTLEQIEGSGALGVSTVNIGD